MGVLACDRAGCVNIMCDRLSGHYGYICDECFEELVARGAMTDIANFMASSVAPPRGVKADAYLWFSKVFPIR